MFVSLTINAWCEFKQFEKIPKKALYHKLPEMDLF